MERSNREIELENKILDRLRLLREKSCATRRKGLKELNELLEVKEFQVLISKNTNKGNGLTWHKIIAACYEGVVKDIPKDPKKASITSWEIFKTILSLSEKDGSCLHTSSLKKICAVPQLLETQSHIQALGPIVLQILERILRNPRYRMKLIETRLYRYLFGELTGGLLNNNVWAHLISSDAQRLTECVSLSIRTCPHEDHQFLRETIFPFFYEFFKNQYKFDFNERISEILLRALNMILRTHGFDLLYAVRMLLKPAAKFMTKYFKPGKRCSSVLKTEIANFFNLIFDLESKLPVKYFDMPNVHFDSFSTLYAAIRKELQQMILYTSTGLHSVNYDTLTRFSTEEKSFLRFASRITHMMEPLLKNKQWVKRNPNQLKDEIEDSLPAPKRQKVNRNSVFSTGNLGKSMLKFISVYAEEPKLEFHFGSYDSLVKQIVSNMSIRGHNDTDFVLWSIRCLCALAQHTSTSHPTEVWSEVIGTIVVVLSTEKTHVCNALLTLLALIIEHQNVPDEKILQHESIIFSCWKFKRKVSRSFGSAGVKIIAAYAQRFPGNLDGQKLSWLLQCSKPMANGWFDVNSSSEICKAIAAFHGIHLEMPVLSSQPREEFWNDPSVKREQWNRLTADPCFEYESHLEDFFKKAEAVLAHNPSLQLWDASLGMTCHHLHLCIIFNLPSKFVARILELLKSFLGKNKLYRSAHVDFLHMCISLVNQMPVQQELVSPLCHFGSAVGEIINNVVSSATERSKGWEHMDIQTEQQHSHNDRVERTMTMIEIVLTCIDYATKSGVPVRNRRKDFGLIGGEVRSNMETLTSKFLKESIQITDEYVPLFYLLTYFVVANNNVDNNFKICLSRIKNHFLKNSSGSHIDQDRWHGPRIRAFARILELIKHPTEDIKSICLDLEKIFDETMYISREANFLLAHYFATFHRHGMQNVGKDYLTSFFEEDEEEENSFCSASDFCLRKKIGCVFLHMMRTFNTEKAFQNCVELCFDGWFDEHTEIDNGDDLQEKSSDQVNCSEVLSSMAALSQMGLHSMKYEREIVYLFCTLAAEEHLLPYVLTSFPKFSELVGQLNLVEKHLDFLLKAWVNGGENRKKRRLKDFPVRLIREDMSLIEFIFANEAEIITMLLVTLNEEMMSEIAKKKKVKLKTLVEPYFAKLFACSFIYLDGNDSRCEAHKHGEKMMKKLKKIVGAQMFKSAFKDRLIPVFLEILSCYVKTWKSEAHIRCTFRNLREYCKKKTFNEILQEKQTGVFHHALLHLRFVILESAHPEERDNAMRIMLLLSEDMIPHSLTPSVFRIAVTSMIWVLRKGFYSKETCSVLITTLRKYIDSALKGDIELLGQFARDAIEGLLEVTEANRDLTDAIKPVVNSIFDQRKVPCISKAISELVYIPIDFQDAKLLHEELCGSRSLKDEIQHFLPRAKSGNFKAEASLSRLHSKLSEADVSELKKVKKSVLVEVVVQLISLCQLPSLRNVCGKCLSALQILDLDFTINSSAQSIDFDLFTPSGKARHNFDILQAVNSYVVNDDPCVMRIAAETLTSILSATSESELGMENLSRESARLLMPFQSDSLVPAPDVEEFAFSCWSVENVEIVSWVRRVVPHLISLLPGDADVILLASKKLTARIPGFAEKLFPFVIWELITKLTLSDEQACGIFSDLMEKFNHIFCSEKVDTRIVDLLISTVQMIRSTWIKHNLTASGSREKRLLKSVQLFLKGVNYIDLANSAQRIDHYMTSILFLELEAKRRHPEKPMFHILPQEDGQLQDLLLTAYRHVGDIDGIYGVTRSVGDTAQQLMLLEHERRVGTALQTYDIHLSHEPAKQQDLRGMMQMLSQMGCNYLTNVFMQSLKTANPEQYLQVSEGHYKSAWRACKWDLEGAAKDFSPTQMSLDRTGSTSSDTFEEKVPTSTSSPQGFHFSVYNALRCLRSNEPAPFHDFLKSARESILTDIGLIGAESFRSLTPIFIKLYQLNDLEMAWKLKYEDEPIRPSILQEVCLGFALREDRALVSNSEANVSNLPFSSMEPILQMQGALLSICGTPELQARHLLQIVRWSRDGKELSSAWNALTKAKVLASELNKKELQAAVILQEALLHHADNNPSRAISLVKGGFNFRQENDKKLVEVSLHCGLQYATWITQSGCSQEINEVLKQTRAVSKEGAKKWGLTFRNIYVLSLLHFARFEDSIYRNQRDVIESEEWKRNKIRVDGRLEVIKLCDKRMREIDSAGKTNALKLEWKKWYRQKHVTQKKYNHDTQQMQLTIDRKQKYLEAAVTHYIQYISSAKDVDNIAIFRLVSLWFENIDNTQVSKLISMAVAAPKQNKPKVRVPTYRFMPLVYQIASRIKSGDHPFHKAVTSLMTLMATEHPYHCVYQICHQKYGKKKNPIANVILDKMKLSEKTARVVETTEDLIQGYIQLAEKKVGKEVKEFPLSRFKLSNVSGLGILPVPTQNLPVKRDSNYYKGWDAIMMHEFDSRVKMAESGIHRPKILNIRGTDGKLHKQLLKPDDDLRQDAVMEQLFMLVDGLLKKSPDARRRNLNMRTYVVIPITEKVGVLEWVMDTIPIGIWQIDAHKRYYPKDMGPIKARHRMHGVAGKKLNVKLKAFQDICVKFHPVMHKFFLEKFSDSCTWFMNRQRYARSLAVICVVGYVVGLGDRHTQNILIDLKTAELIHIDLGIAFDQGKLLKTPEIVPFRLTRDLVDALGLQGVKGTFTRSAICTMKLLREYSDMMMTVLEVFVHDPLYKWHLSEERINQLQSDLDEKDSQELEILKENPEKESVAGVKEAMRAIFLLKQKFLGIVEGEQLSVEGQVSKLVQGIHETK